MTPTTPSYIHTYAEPVKAGYSILRVDVVVDGQLVPELSHTIGSPAPTETVKQYEQMVKL